MTNLVGVRDKPVETVGDECLGLEPYATSLARFILACDTPMTVGLQGEWGTGKTSLMNMIRATLDEQDVPTVWVDTWAYAQVHDGDQLALAILSGVVEALGQVAPRKVARTAKQGLGWIRSQLTTAAKVAVATKGGDLGSVLDKSETEQVALEVDRLKVEIAEVVSSAVGGRARLALFVDDLDRVRPDRAVRLLEAFKNFLDVPGLVTVLACDYGVVQQGLAAVMGVTEETLGRSFFDKIIQVPFRMPTSRYRHRPYLANLLGAIGIQVTEGELDIVLEVLEPTVGLNPRTLKRLANSLLLLLNVAEVTQAALLERPRARLLLLALAAIEDTWGEVSDHLLDLARRRDREGFRRMLAQGPDGTSEPPFDRSEVQRCLRALHDLVDTDEDDFLDRSCAIPDWAREVVPQSVAATG